TEGVAVGERLDGGRWNAGVGQRVLGRLGEELGRRAVVQPELRHSDSDHGDAAHECPPRRMLALKFMALRGLVVFGCGWIARRHAVAARRLRAPLLAATRALADAPALRR